MIRRYYTSAEPIHKGHTIRLIDVSYEDVMNWEESAVDYNKTLAPNGLNMIPGGFKGIKELYKLGILNNPQKASEE